MRAIFSVLNLNFFFVTNFRIAFIDAFFVSISSLATAPRWDDIAYRFPGKSPIDCLSQWQTMALPDQVKGKGSWSNEEDSILRAKRALYGRKWSKIAEFLPGRSGKQCRERFVNHLDPQLKKGEWTDDEEALLIGMHKNHGNKWTIISNYLPGRSGEREKSICSRASNRLGVSR